MLLDIRVYRNILTMHGTINVKSPNNISKWQMEFNSAFKGLIHFIFSIYIQTASESMFRPIPSRHLQVFLIVLKMQKQLFHYKTCKLWKRIYIKTHLHLVYILEMRCQTYTFSFTQVSFWQIVPCDYVFASWAAPTVLGFRINGSNKNK
jgi:hypothetical protein